MIGVRRREPATAGWLGSRLGETPANVANASCGQENDRRGNVRSAGVDPSLNPSHPSFAYRLGNAHAFLTRSCYWNDVCTVTPRVMRRAVNPPTP